MATIMDRPQTDTGNIKNDKTYANTQPLGLDAAAAVACERQCAPLHAFCRAAGAALTAHLWRCVDRFGSTTCGWLAAITPLCRHCSPDCHCAVAAERHPRFVLSPGQHTPSAARALAVHLFGIRLGRKAKEALPQRVSGSVPAPPGGIPSRSAGP